MIPSPCSQHEEAKVAVSDLAIIPFRWIREVDAACDRWFIKRGIPTFTFRQKITLYATDTAALRMARAHRRVG